MFGDYTFKITTIFPRPQCVNYGKVQQKLWIICSLNFQLWHNRNWSFVIVCYTKAKSLKKVNGIWKWKTLFENKLDKNRYKFSLKKRMNDLCWMAKDVFLHDDIIKWEHFPHCCKVEFWCFLWCASEQTAEQTIEVPVIWDSIVLIMTSL